ncbi:MAG: serine/threonine-protein phosphatase [Deltaproteobacteria bacterium]|jgi:protein phosphatase|nr:serine/threonine-protein phosphatase [Deltaproteobacteria bacterium]
MKAVFFSSPGPSRLENEDGLFLSEILVDRDTKEPEYREINPQSLVAVADGMGGGPGGREAAFLVLTKLSELAHQPLTEAAQHLVEDNIKNAALALALVAQRNPTLQQMGSALSGLWLGQDQALAFNCGDCRVYRIREGFLDLLTQDHSLVYELYLNGQITEEAMGAHPLKNILTSSIQDNPEPPRIFCRRIAVLPGDNFFLCSDGVWEAVSRREMEKWIALEPTEGAPRLAETLLTRAKDNFTFLWLY